MKQKLCPSCKERYVKIHNNVYSTQCLFCSYKSKYIKKELIRINCKECNKLFLPVSHNQKYCQNPCNIHLIKNKNKNQNWLKSEPKKPTKRRDENQVAYGFFRKKYEISKVYNACRG
jgi:hypothetical protein